MKIINLNLLLNNAAGITSFWFDAVPMKDGSVYYAAANPTSTMRELSFSRPRPRVLTRLGGSYRKLNKVEYANFKYFSEYDYEPLTIESGTQFRI